MTTKEPNIFKQALLSLYSFKDYPRMGRSRGGKVFLFSLLLIVLTYAVTCILPLLSVLPVVFNLDERTVNEYVPYFEVRDGRFFIEREVVYEEDADGLSILFYATSDYEFPVEDSREVLRGFDQGFIISPDAMVVKQLGGAIQEFSFAQFLDIDRAVLYELLPWVKVTTAATFIFIALGYAAVYAFGWLVCAVIGMLVNAFVKAPVDFVTVFKLSAFARTVPILVKMACFLLPVPGLHFVFFYALFILYMVMGLRAVKSEAAALPVSHQV